VAVFTEFYEINQATEMFVPKNPLRLPLKRNTLYPFFVYGENDASDEQQI